MLVPRGTDREADDSDWKISCSFGLEGLNDRTLVSWLRISNSASPGRNRLAIALIFTRPLLAHNYIGGL